MQQLTGTTKQSEFLYFLLLIFHAKVRCEAVQNGDLHTQIVKFGGILDEQCVGFGCRRRLAEIYVYII